MFKDARAANKEADKNKLLNIATEDNLRIDTLYKCISKEIDKAVERGDKKIFIEKIYGENAYYGLRQYSSNELKELCGHLRASGYKCDIGMCRWRMTISWANAVAIPSPENIERK